jgi:hypothetical protein
MTLFGYPLPDQEPPWTGRTHFSYISYKTWKWGILEFQATNPLQMQIFIIVQYIQSYK